MTMWKLMNIVVHRTQREAVENGAEAIPVQMFYMDRYGDVDVLKLDGAPVPKDRPRAVAFLRDVLTAQRATSYVMVMESWSRTFSPGEEAEGIRAAREGIKDDPKRRECVVYLAGDVNAGFSREYSIDRAGGVPEKGAMTGFHFVREENFDRNSTIEGWAVGLLWG